MERPGTYKSQQQTTVRVVSRYLNLQVHPDVKLLHHVL